MDDDVSQQVEAWRQADRRASAAEAALSAARHAHLTDAAPEPDGSLQANARLLRTAADMQFRSAVAFSKNDQPVE